LPKKIKELMNSMIFKKSRVINPLIIACLALGMGLCGCKSAEQKALQWTAQCRDAAGPARERAQSCIALAGLTGKTHLDLVDFGLKQLPPALFELEGLTSLNLGNNQLTSLPDQIGKLKNLTTLHLFGNQLKTLPQSMAELKKLRWLTLNDNHLDTLPPVICHLPRLRRLSLQANNLNALPDRFDALAHLELINLKHNHIAALPPSLTGLQELRRLFLDHNRFATFDIAPGNLPALEQLSLTGNNIERIGPGIAALPNLWNLVLEKSRYKALPEEIEPLKPFIFPCEIDYDESKPEEYRKKYELFLHYAKAGDYRAQFKLSLLMVFSSENSPYRDIEKGLEWIRKAALKSGNAHIQYGLGMMLYSNEPFSYEDSEEKKISDIRKEAFQSFLASAGQGHAYAQMEVAIYYYTGRRDIPRDFSQAYTWFKLASNRFQAKAIMVDGKDISEKGLVGRFMKSIENSSNFSAKDKALALKRAEQWEDDHPDAYKCEPYFDCYQE
jgi:Leucine-rich repeat (LRR) protein